MSAEEESNTLDNSIKDCSDEIKNGDQGMDLDDLNSPSDQIQHKMDIDDVFGAMSSFCRFQLLLQSAILYIFLTISYNFVLGYFTGSNPPWTCIRNSSSNFCASNYGKEISSGSDQFSQRCFLNRSEWKYKTENSYSFVTEFDLICGKKALAAIISSAYYGGGILGAIISGTLTDVYGRKIVLQLSLLGTTASSIGCSFATNNWQLTGLNAALGAFSVVLYFTSFVYQSEFTTPRLRSIVGTASLLVASVSFELIDVIANNLPNWRKLQLYASLPCLLVVPITIFLPESPRWLLVTGKDERATNIMKKICKFNGKAETNIQLKRQVNSDDTRGKQYTYLDLFRCCKVLVLTSSASFLWFTVAIVFYAIALESSNLGGNMYQAFFLSTLADIFAAFTCPYTLNRFGRKKTILLGFLVSGALCASMLLVPRSLSCRYIINIVIMTSARLVNCNSFYGLYTWSFEMFPTVLRSQGMSVCVILERIGLLVVPFITTVLNEVSYMMPFIIMSSLSILASVVGLVLPETNKLPTREKYEDFFQARQMRECPESGIDNSEMERGDYEESPI